MSENVGTFAICVILRQTAAGSNDILQVEVMAIGSGIEDSATGTNEYYTHKLIIVIIIIMNY